MLRSRGSTARVSRQKIVARASHGYTYLLISLAPCRVPASNENLSLPCAADTGSFCVASKLPVLLFLGIRIDKSGAGETVTEGGSLGLESPARMSAIFYSSNVLNVTNHGCHVDRLSCCEEDVDGGGDRCLPSAER